MNKALIIFFAGLAFAGAVTFVAARSSSPEQASAATRASASAESAYAQAGGDNVSASVPVTVFAPRYGSSPRIIHVPQYGASVEANANDGDSAIATIDGAGDVPPPRAPLVKRIKPAPRYSDVAPVVPVEKRVTKTPVLPRTVTTLPPSKAADSAPADTLTPIYPTPKYNSSVGKPSEPVEPARVDLPPPPPPGYTPPSGLHPQPK
jgi:hypothetical protein